MSVAVISPPRGLVDSSKQWKAAPSYLRNLLTTYEPGRAGLRSSRDMLRLAVPSTKRVTGESAFSVLGPRLWNSLPLELRHLPSVCIFKKRLKTYLFPKL